MPTLTAAACSLAGHSTSGTTTSKAKKKKKAKQKKQQLQAQLANQAAAQYDDTQHGVNDHNQSRHHHHHSDASYGDSDEDSLPSLVDDLDSRTLTSHGQFTGHQQQHHQQQGQFKESLQQGHTNISNMSNQAGTLPYSPTHSSATPSDLLSTASDLYRQIEAAAASALSTHPSFAASFPPPPSGTPNSGGHNNGTQTTATDEAYWTSLPQHLRQFIRSALPLAAGLTTGPNGQPLPNGVASPLSSVINGVNGQLLPPLTHDQLSSAAAQLAQVVQSNWGQLGLGPVPPNLGATGTQGRGAATTTTTGPNGATISLGSFPVSMPTREQMEAAIGSIGGLGGDFGLGGLTPQQQQQFILHQQQQQQQQHNLNTQQQQPGGADGYPYDRQAGDETEEEDGAQQPANESAASKKKNKKKKKKNNTAAPLASADAVQAAVAADVAARAAADNAAAANAKMRTTATVTVPPPRQQQTTAAGKQPQQALTQQQQHQAYLASAPSIAPKAGPSSERERIRDFWLGLQESERRALVKVEKEAVLKKMKEQQRSGCSCAVCGRKR